MTRLQTHVRFSSDPALLIRKLTDVLRDHAETINALTASAVTELPIGSIHITVDPTNPATTLGYGTWSAFGTGRVLVGVDVGDADFDTVEETGGSKTATI